MEKQGLFEHAKVPKPEEKSAEDLAALSSLPSHPPLANENREADPASQSQPEDATSALKTKIFLEEMVRKTLSEYLKPSD